jgi:hypothetical protein
MQKPAPNWSVGGLAKKLADLAVEAAEAPDRLQAVRFMTPLW